MLARNIAFYLLAAAMVAAAFRLVTTKNVVRAALFLAIVLAGAAGQFLLLAAEFVAVVQYLVYIGAIVVLFLFGVMLTRAKLGAEGDLNNAKYWHAAPVALLMLGVMVYVLIDGFEDQKLPDDMNAVPTSALSDDIFKPYLLPFWALSFVLLAAVIGAIVLARKD